MQAGVNLTLGLYFGAMQVSVTAFAVEHSAAETAAPLYAVSNCAGLLAGWLYGLRRWRAAQQVQLAIVSAGLALSCLPLLVADSFLGMGFVLTVTGIAIPPVLVLSSVLTTAAVDRAALTQAFTWLNSASAAGSAVRQRCPGARWTGTARTAASRSPRRPPPGWQYWPRPMRVLRGAAVSSPGSRLTG